MLFRFEHIQYFCREVERQKDGPEHVFGMAKGFARAFGHGILATDDINLINSDITLCKRRVDYRITPVHFASGGHAANWQIIPNAMYRWWENRPKRLSLLEDYPNDIQVVDEWVKAFLDIHPYEDGNGRTASILRNWALGKFDDPADLPYYNF